MDKPTSKQAEILGQELWKELPSSVVDWMPSNFCSHFAMIILAREAGLREQIELYKQMESKFQERVDYLEAMVKNRNQAVAVGDQVGAEIACLRSALEKYGQHLQDCPTHMEEGSIMPSCNCGLDAALQGGSDG